MKPQAGKIFISYDREDRQKAATVAEALRSSGYEVWWDREIQPGATFSKVIEAELKQACCVLVLWTHASVRSEWVEIEAAKAKSRGVLVPVLLDDVALDIPLEFSRIEAANLVGWQAGEASPEWNQLLREVHRYSGLGVLPESAVSLPNTRPSGQRQSAGRWLGTAAVTFVSALLFDFLISQRLYNLRKIGNASQLYGRELVFDIVMLGLFWAVVALVSIFAGRAAKRAGLKGWSFLAWIMGGAGLVVFLFELIVGSQRFSDGPSFSFPYYAIAKESLIYHCILFVCLFLISGAMLLLGQRKAKTAKTETSK